MPAGTKISLAGKIITLCFLLVGCSLYRSPLDKDMPEFPSAFQRQVEQPAPSTDRWWLLFEDPALNGLIDDMLRDNPDLKEASARWRRFMAEYKITDSARKITVNLSASGGRERVPSAVGARTDNIFGASVAAGYEVDLWNKLSADSRAALGEIFATEADVQALYISLTASVGDLYYQIIESKHQVLLLRQTIESFRQALDLVENKYLQGVVSILDVYQAQQNLAEALAQQPNLEQELAVREHALSLLVGRYPQVGGGGDKQELPPVPPPLPVELPATVLKRRPDIQAALLRLKAADARVEAAVADRFPSFNLAAAAGYTASEVSNLFQADHFFWDVIGQLIQPVIDGGKRTAEVERRKAQYEELLNNYRRAVLRAFQEVEDAVVKNINREARIARLKDLVETSANVLEVSLYQYVQGVSDYLPVLTAQKNYYLAKRQLITDRRALIGDRIELARVLGGSWQQPAVEERLSARMQE